MPHLKKKRFKMKYYFKGIIIHTHLNFNRCLLCRIGVAVLISGHVDPVHGGVALTRHVAHVHVVRPHLVGFVSEKARNPHNNKSHMTDCSILPPGQRGWSASTWTGRSQSRRPCRTGRHHRLRAAWLDNKMKMLFHKKSFLTWSRFQPCQHFQGCQSPHTSLPH